MKVNKGQRSTILINLLNSLADRGSWCGETHIQKAAFLLQETAKVQTGFNFILYKHGPFSFELRDSLAELAAEGLIDYVVRDPTYGPSVVVTKESRDFLERFPKTEKKHAKQVEFVAKVVGKRNVAELERIGTAVFLIRRGGNIDPDDRASEIVELKPHVSIFDAREAMCEAEKLMLVSEKEFKGRK